MVKFLIVRFSSIGDIILTTPVVRALKSQVEGSEVHFLTKKKFSTLLEANPYIDTIQTLDRSFRELIIQLRGEKYDYIIDLHRNLRTLRLKLNLRAISFTFPKLNWQKWLLVNLRVNKLPSKHIVDRYFEAVEIFDILNDGKGLDYYIPEHETENAAKILKDLQTPFVIVVVGGGHFTKQIPIQKLRNIVKLIRYTVLLLGGSEDKDKAEKVAEGFSEKIFNLTGLLSIHESAWMIKHSLGIITPDTGLMHIAAALKKKIFSVWGNTIPEFGMYPYMPDEGSHIFEVKNLKCRPCSKIGYEKCPKGHFKCMMDINTTEIITGINNLSDKSLRK